MNKVLNETLTILKTQWQLLVVNSILAVIFSINYGLTDENFGYMILAFFPYMAWIIFYFVLTKLIYDKKEDSKTTFLNQIKTYWQYLPKLFFPMIGVSILILIVMFIVITMSNGILNITGLSNGKSIFESNPTDLNYLLGYLLFSLVTAFIIFQPAIYFVQKQSFFTALKNSILVGKKHWQFVLTIGVIYFLQMLLASVINTDLIYLDVVVGFLDGAINFVTTTIILLYYLYKVK